MIHILKVALDFFDSSLFDFKAAVHYQGWPILNYRKPLVTQDVVEFFESYFQVIRFQLNSDSFPQDLVYLIISALQLSICLIYMGPLLAS